jgi:hypothetical protein
MMENRFMSFYLLIPRMVLFALLGVILTSGSVAPQISGKASQTVDHKWVSIAAGKSHSLAVKSDGTLWTWGLNEYGRLGDVTTEERYSPIQIDQINLLKKHP